MAVCSHLGRPRGERKQELSLAPAAARLGELMGRRVELLPDCVGEEVRERVSALAAGELVMLENLRFHAEEEKDDETFLPWARDRFACVIFNLHVVHTPAGTEQAAGRFRRLIDMARARRGSFFLTYHRFATREQIEDCYPGFRDFLDRKRQVDPEERFQSEWYRHYRTMFQQ